MFCFVRCPYFAVVTVTLPTLNLKGIFCRCACQYDLIKLDISSLLGVLVYCYKRNGKGNVFTPSICSHEEGWREPPVRRSPGQTLPCRQIPLDRDPLYRDPPWMDPPFTETPSLDAYPLGREPRKEHETTEVVLSYSTGKNMGPDKK